MIRIETDFIGEMELPDNALYGIHSARAVENFPFHSSFHIEWYKAMGSVKLACYNTYSAFAKAVKNKYGEKEFAVRIFTDKIIEVLAESAKDIQEGKYFEWFVVPSMQGGAGTSINMNVNEIIANTSLLKLGFKPGNYKEIDPIEHANIFQSTNDVVPTALKVAVIELLLNLEKEINAMRSEIERLEKANRNTLRIGYTQMQEAVPSSFGRLFGAYNDMFSRDWWRVSKCFERIKTVNLGGSAIGTAITVPRFFLIEAISSLQSITGLPISRAENMCDNTSNLDAYVEIHAILKAHAVNLEKMVNDLRLLASDLSHNEISIPQKQVGSSVMPGKVNPVIAEFVVSATHKVYSNDVLLTSLCSQGCLELNAYLPMIGHTLLESIKLLIAANKTIKNNLLNGLIVNSELSELKLLKSASITTALLPYIGYHKSAELAKYMKLNHVSIFEANSILQLVGIELLKSILKPENLLKEGFTMEELYKDK